MINDKSILGVSEVAVPTSLAGIFKVIRDIQVVSALPAIPVPGVTYLVGAQTTISITGLNGNVDDTYQIIADVINSSGSDNINLRFNNIATSVYDFRYAYAGSTSNTASGLPQSAIIICPTSGSGSVNHISIEMDVKTGKNRNILTTASQIGANQQLVAGLLVSGGIWRDNSTNITSMQFGYSSISNGYGVGTRIRLFSLQS